MAATRCSAPSARATVRSGPAARRARPLRRAARAPAAPAVAVSAKPETAADEAEPKDNGVQVEGNLTLSPEQVTSLMTMVCEETDLAQVDIELGGYKFHMKRKVGAGAKAAAAEPLEAAPAPAAPAPAPATPFAAAAEPSASGNGFFSAAEGEGLHIEMIKSPKVGVMRRGRGKGPPAVEEGDDVKKGQVVGYVEQLGTLSPIEAEVAGEVYEVLVDDLEPVEFGQPVLAIVPSFVGIKKGAGSGTGQMA